MHSVISKSLPLVLSVAAAAGAFAQEQPAPAPVPPPRPRAATNRSIYIHKSGSSYLGIGVAEVDGERAKSLGLKEVRGVEVKSVASDSPASKAGLKDGDVVLEYNSQRIEGTEQFVRLVRETPVDRQVRLQVWRNGATLDLTATIGHRTENFTIHGDDGDEFSVEIPPMPPMPPMPEVAPMPDFPHAMSSVRSGMLGIESETLGSQLAEFFGVKEGVLVRSVIKSSAAEKAGIRAGDVIVKVDGETVTSPREITSVLRAARTKRTFPVVVVREKKEVTLTVTLESSGGATHGMRAVPVLAKPADTF